MAPPNDTPTLLPPLTRRGFLKLSLLASGSFLLTGAMSGAGGAPRHSDRVLVVGAGMAGLTVARRLFERGFEVTVVEGRDRLGGRTWTDDSLGVPVDMGAAWIHGHQGNPLTDLAAQYGILTAITDLETLTLYDSDGRELTDSELDELDSLYEEAAGQLRALKAEASAETTMATAIEAVLSDYASLSPVLLRGLQWLLVSNIELVLGADFGELSLQMWDEDLAFEGEERVLTTGYKGLIDGLADGLDVRLRHRVQRIAHSDSGVTVETDRGTFTADRVVVTVPLGVLKANHITFDPPLPAEKRAAIDRLAMGDLNKIALRFPEVFWPEETYHMGYLEASTETTTDFFPLNPYTNGEPVLVALARGVHARSLPAMTDAERTDGVMADLRAMFGDAVPDPEAVVFTQWRDDPFSEGSYPVMPAGSSLSDFASIAEPVGDRLFFAGDATHDLYPGTAHGAHLSGLREADRLATMASFTEDIAEVPGILTLEPAYPNPFRASTSIAFELTEPRRVDARVIDTLGRHVVQLAEEAPHAAGTHLIQWDGTDQSGRDVPAGIYLLEVRTNRGYETAQNLIRIR